MPHHAASEPEPKRVPGLSLLADVRVGETLPVLALTANVFILLCAYYLLKVAREPLILASGSANVKSYAAAGQALVLVVVSQLYGALAGRLDRIRLVTSVTLFFVSNLVLFAVLAQAGASIGVPFFLWVGIFNLMVIAQFWSFAADLYSSEDGKRLFPIVGLGSSVGAIAGSTWAKRLVGLGPATLMATGAVLLVVSLLLTRFVHKSSLLRRAKSAADAAENGQTPPPEAQELGGPSGAKLIVTDRFLVGVAVLMLLINVVNTTGENLFDRALLAAAPQDTAARVVFIGAKKAEFFTYVNGAAVLLQMFVVSRVLKHLGLTIALTLVPLVSLFGYGSLAITPILSVIFVAKVAENSLDYSLQNTARQTLWLVTSRAAKYKAKAIIDTFIVRGGDVVAAGVVAFGAQQALTTPGLARVNVVMVCLWLAVAIFVAREYAKRAAANAEKA